MTCSKRDNGWTTFWEHYGFSLIAILAATVTFGLDFFTNLQGDSWIRFFVVSQVLLVSGAVLIGAAKFPVYRSGRFFTFGIKSVPIQFAGIYRWGWRGFLSGVVLSLCLLISKQ
jgi:hypothetical protein